MSSMVSLKRVDLSIAQLRHVGNGIGGHLPALVVIARQAMPQRVHFTLVRARTAVYNRKHRTIVHLILRTLTRRRCRGSIYVVTLYAQCLLCTCVDAGVPVIILKDEA